MHQNQKRSAVGSRNNAHKPPTNDKQGIKVKSNDIFVTMVLVATNTRDAHNDYCFNSSSHPNPASFYDNLDDFSIAVTVKRSNITKEVSVLQTYFI